MKTLLVLLAGLVIAPSAVAGEDDLRRRIAEIARGCDADDPAAVERARATLVALAPDTWLEHVPQCPLLQVLAEGLSHGEAVAAFESAGKDPVHGVDRWAALAANLSFRPDLSAILFEVGAVEPLAAKHPKLLMEIASDAVLDGKLALALRLLANPELTVEFAERLLKMNRPEGLRLVVDVLAENHELPADARAMLGLVGPDVHNQQPTRPLGRERTALLGRIAANDLDPALRTLAARLLAFSLDPDAFGLTVSAYVDGRSSDVSEDEWEVLGKFFSSSWSDASVPLRAREALLEGHLYRGHVSADGDPLYAEAAAARLRAMTAEHGDVRFRGMLLRFLDHWAHVFVDRTHLRSRPVPSFLGLLDDLEMGRPEDPQGLKDLARRFVPKFRRYATGGSGDRARKLWGPYLDAKEVASPVHSLIPQKGRVPDDTAALVREWLEKDARHLFDAEVAKKFEQLRPGERRRILESYPAEAIAGMLALPPSRFGLIRKGLRGDDLTGDRSRGRLLELLVDAPAHAALVLVSPGLADWNTECRFQAGRVLQGSKDWERVQPLLADDLLAAGYHCQSLLRPESDDLTGVARIVVGEADRPATLARMADWMLDEMPERLGPRDDEVWPAPAEPVSAELRAKLEERVRAAADPAVCWLAARILALSGTPADLEAILRSGGELDVGVSRGWHAFSDLAYRVDSERVLDVVLAGLENRKTPPRARLALFHHLDLSGARFPPALHETLVEKLTTWIRERLPKLDGDLPEQMLVAMMEYADNEAEERARRLYLEVLERLPLAEMKIRLRSRSLYWR